MIFFTYFLNAPVRDSQGQTIGKATDALIRLEQSQDASPLISMIVSSGRNRFCIVVESIESWGPGAVVLDRKMADAQVRCPEGDDVVSLRKTVLDKQIVDLVKKKLHKVPPGQEIDFIKADNSQNKPRVNFYHKDTEQVHVVLGMFGIEYRHPDRYALGLLNIILGGNMSSRLFNEIREKRGLAYSISTSVRYLHDTGMFMVRAGVDNQKVVPAVGLILKELKKVKL